MSVSKLCDCPHCVCECEDCYYKDPPPFIGPQTLADYERSEMFRKMYEPMLRQQLALGTWMTKYTANMERLNDKVVRFEKFKESDEHRSSS